MAQLPSTEYLIQQIGGEVVLFHRGTEEEIVRFDPADQKAAARAQGVIYLSGLTDEDKCFAHFWCGYFYAHASMHVPECTEDQSARMEEAVLDE